MSLKSGILPPKAVELATMHINLAPLAWDVTLTAGSYDT